MQNFTPELVEKGKSVKSADALLELAKANGVELTADEAATYFAQLSAKGAVSDDDLDGVAGGGILGCPEDDTPKFKNGSKVRLTGGGKCSQCGCTEGIYHSGYAAGVGTVVKCVNCGNTIIAGYVDGSLELV